MQDLIESTASTGIELQDSDLISCLFISDSNAEDFWGFDDAKEVSNYLIQFIPFTTLQIWIQPSR